METNQEGENRTGWGKKEECGRVEVEHRRELVE